MLSESNDGYAEMFKDLDNSSWRTILQELETLSTIYEISNNIVSFLTIDFLRRIAIKILGRKHIVLEIGPGPGTSTKKILSSAEHLICLEPSPYLASILMKKIGDKSLSVIIGVAEKIPLKSNSVDAIICTFSFRDFFNKEAFLREAYRCLRSEGKLIILETMGGEGIVKKLFLNYIYVVGHIISRLLNRRENLLKGLINSMNRMRSPNYYVRIAGECGFRHYWLRKYLFNTTFILVLEK